MSPEVYPPRHQKRRLVDEPFVQGLQVVGAFVAIIGVALLIILLVAS